MKLLKLGLAFLLAITCSLCGATPPTALPYIPDNAKKNLPTLLEQQRLYWPDMKYPKKLAAQTEQETCRSLKHPTCWSPNAKLQTSREYGFSFGQFTVAYNKDGSERFNTWKDLRNKYAELRDWTWDNRLDPVLGMRALVLYDRQIFKVVSQLPSNNPMFSYDLMFASYNGGQGGTLQEVRMCKALPNCDPTSWYPKNGKLGVRDVSKKSRVTADGYGKSFFQINREYVDNIYVREVKYIPYIGEDDE